MEQHKKQVILRMEEASQTARKLLSDGHRERALTAIKKKRIQAQIFLFNNRSEILIYPFLLQSKLVDQADEKILRIYELLQGIETAHHNKLVRSLLLRA